jgi:hypothetical protein
MKKIISIILFATLLVVGNVKNINAQSVNCCPDFELKQDNEPTQACRGNCPQEATAPGGMGKTFVSCRTTHQYMIVPNLTASGYTYNWTVIGGTPSTFTGNPINITWGSNNNVEIIVTITGPNGCSKTIKRKICLVDGPVANILNATPNPICNGGTVNFSAANTTTLSYNWSFGDGTYGSGQNISHTYATGVYQAILTVQSDSNCNCIDRDTVQIVVNSGNGLQINPISCKKMFCPGDTSSYTAVGCTGPYTWTVVGGTPSSFVGNTINITWNANSLVPASVSVTAASCPGGCGNTASLQVPVMFPNLQITGANPVCAGSTTHYSLPHMPGAFYKWTLGSGGVISGPDSNVNTIAVNWNPWPATSGPHQIICNYNNPITGCSGADTILINVKPPLTINGPLMSCVGNGFAYSNSALPGDPLTSWSITPSHPFAPGGSTPTISGIWGAANTYTISATAVNASNYCKQTADLSVQVFPKAVLTTINGPSAICAGSTHVYSVNTNLPGQGEFAWTITGGTFIPLGDYDDSAQVTWNPVGPYIISVVQTINNICPSNTVTLNVTPIAAPTIAPNPGPFCMDATSNFTASPVLAAGQYTWSIGNSLGSLMSPQGNNTMSVQWNGTIAPGTSTAIITVTNHCNLSASTTVNVVTPNPVTITQSGDLCNPTGIQLNATAGFSSYSWSGPSGYSQTGNPVNATIPGLYTVIATDANGCTVKNTSYVLPKVLPNVSISAAASLVYCPGDAINITFNSSFSSPYVGCTYQWYQNGVPMPGQTGTSLTITNASLQNNPGSNNFNLVVTCGGCTVSSNTKTVTVLASCPPGSGCPFLNAGAKMSATPKIKKGSDAEDIIVPGLGDVTITSPANNSNLCNSSGSYTFTSLYNLYQNTFSIAAAWWDFGDGTTANGTQTGSGMGPYNNTVNHIYTNCGNYMVVFNVVVQCSPGVYCYMSDTINVNVLAIAKFNPVVVCNKVYLQDLSKVCQTTCNFNYTWSATGPGTVSFAPSASGLYSSMASTTVMTATASGAYTITLTLNSASCGCTVVYSQVVNINMPTAAFTAPSPVCAKTPITFTGSGGTSYAWNFYSTYVSNLQTTVHSFPAPPPGVRPVTLTVTDANGCTNSITQNITVLPELTVAINGAADICPGQSVTLTTTPAAFSGYQWYHNGNAISTAATLVVTQPGEYWVEVNNGSGCKAKSAKVTIKLKQMPKIKIKPQSVVCIGAGGNINGNLSNYTYEANVNYTWSQYSGPSTLNFSPNGTNFSNNTNVTASGALPGDYIVILTGVHTISGCIKRDTICIKAYNKPVFSVSGPTNVCEGILHTYNAAPAASYNYLWSNGITGSTMSTSFAGSYSVTAIDPISGCSRTLPAGIINPKPNVSLFPISSCDTLCDTVKIVPPLPLQTPQTYGIYTIKWYDGATLIHTGPFLPVNLLTPNPGWHNIHIVVTNAFGCTSTSADYRFYLKPCKDCDCKGSHWGDIILTEGDIKKAKGEPIKVGDVKLGAKNKANVPAGIKLECKNTVPYILKCNQPYTINANYTCVGDSCPGKVTFKLTLPNSSVITGNVAYTFTPTLNGIYTLMLYGWCGDKICDSCLITFKVDCVEPPKECCKESKWEVQPYYYFEGEGKPNPIKIDCNKETVVSISGKDCKKPLVVGGIIACPPGCVATDTVFVYDALNNLVQVGPAPYSITSLPNGTYTVVIHGYCNGQLCLRCKFILKVNCKEEPPCDCKGSKWGERIVTIGNTSQSFNCNKSYEVKCKTPISINANYICADPACNGAVTYTLTQPSGTTTGNVPLNFTPTSNGVYSVTLYGWCGGIKCDSCNIRFIVKDCDTTNCCPYEIKVTPKEVTYISNPTSTTVSNNFSISGIPAGVNITEVRANVVSYTIDDNFKGDCMKCVNLPFTWASTATATNIATAPPKITMFGGATVPSFNGSGAGAYQNPREVIWNNGTNLNSPVINNIGMGFILPPTPNIDCCELKGKICVKFTFRNDKCEECEAIGCFEFVIKKK